MPPHIQKPKTATTDEASFSSDTNFVKKFDECATISCRSSIDQPEVGGVVVPPLLRPLFGLDYLPFPPTENARSVQEPGVTGADKFEIVSRCTNSTSGKFNETLPQVLFVQEPQQDPDDDLQPDNSGSPTKKKKSAIGKIKSRVRKVKERRSHRRVRLGSHASASSAGSGAVDATSQRERLDTAASLTSLQERQCLDHAWVRSRQEKLDIFSKELSSAVERADVITTRAKTIRSRILTIQEEIRRLEEALSESLVSLQSEKELLLVTQTELDSIDLVKKQTEEDVHEIASSLRRGKGCTPRQIPSSRSDIGCAALNNLSGTLKTSNIELPKQCRTLRRSHSSSFMRIHDLDMELSVRDTSSLVSSTSSSVSDMPTQDSEKLFFLDNDTRIVLEALAKYGHEIVTDEGARFKPTRETENILNRRKGEARVDQSSPIQPWHYASGKDILVWTGDAYHNGFGSEFPLIKARGIVGASPRDVVDLILDSARVKEYNKMSLGRSDVVCLQSGVDTTAAESVLGVPGEAKITKSINKPPFIRKNIELLSLIYGRPEENGFLLVSRSVWEGEAPNHNCGKEVMRSEMLLGVNYIRPTGDDGTLSEMTTITHVYSPAVPEMLGKSFLQNASTKAAKTFIQDVHAALEKKSIRNYCKK